MRPHRRRALGAGLLVLGVLNIGLVLSASAAQAQAPDRVGWWFQLQTAGLPAPLPVPTVPDGGLFVQQGPTEPLAYGALHFSPAPSGSSLVELTAAAGSTTIGSAVEACVVTKGWTKPAAAPGAWDARPTFDSPCTRGRISTDGAVVVFFLDQQFVKGGAIDVAIVPVSGATPFSIAFAKPGDHALTAAPAAPSVGAPGSAPTIPRPSVTSPSSSAAGGGAGVVASGRTPSAAPVAGASTPQAAPAAVETAPVPEVATGLPDDVLRAAGFGDPDRGARAMALLGASAIIIGWWLIATQPTRLPRLVGALAGGRGRSIDTASEQKASSRVWNHAGGVGRFARPRGERPRSLR
jgi:hypothetical protein